MTVNPQAQTLLDAAARAEAAGAPAPQELGAVELRALFKATRGELTPEPPDVGHVEDLSPYPVPPEAFPCAITGLRGQTRVPNCRCCYTSMAAVGWLVTLRPMM